MGLPDDDIPEGIPEEDREEFRRLRDERLNDLKNNAPESLEDFIRAQANIHVWRAFIITGQAALVESALKDVFTPDTPVDDDGYPPLVAIARTIPRDVHEAHNLAGVARLLINHGATLNLRDRCGLLPADHAMFSPSTAVAREIVLATLRQNSERASVRFFRPNYRAVFAITTHKDIAEAHRRSLASNIETVRNGLNHAITHGDTLLRELPVSELEYWDRLQVPPLSQLPQPSAALQQAWQSVRSREDAHARGYKQVTKEHIENARDDARVQESLHSRKFKPDYT